MDAFTTSVSRYYERYAESSIPHIAWLGDSEITSLRPGAGKLFRVYLADGTERVVEERTRVYVQYTTEGERR